MKGYCACGCGGKTPIATRNRKDRNQVKGEPLKYINHHHPAWNKDMNIYLGGKRFEKGQKPWNKGTKGLQKAWNKGLKLSFELRIKMSESRKGRVPWNKGKTGVQIAWNKDQIFPQFRGANHPNWQGGKTPEVRRIRNSTEYKQWRRTILEKDNFTCVFCKQRGGKLEVDHIKPFSKYPELRLEISNGRTLCKDCHKTTDTYLRKAILYV